MSDDFLEVNSLIVDDFPRPHLLVPQQHRTDLGHIGTGPRDATAPSAITWTTIYGRLGTTEAEYIAAVEAGKEMIWTHDILSEFGYKVDGASIMKMDNQSAISVSKNPEHHGHMKHLDLCFYWLRNTVESGLISPSYVPTSEMVADIFTKPCQAGFL
jgi:hypothetical protein